MLQLHWDGKELRDPQPATLRLDSVTYPGSIGYPNQIPQDKLILGDNLAVMAALLPEYEGRLNLIYADPPFFTNRHYNARIGRGEDSRKPREWQLTPGYADQWQTAEAYLDFLYQRLALMVRLLASGGTLYLHLDWHADAYARLLLDELLGSQNILNEIIWTYHGPSPIRSAFNRKHDTILVYTKGPKHTFNVDAVRVPYNQMTVKTFASSTKAGFGKVPNLKRGKVPEDWWYFPVVARLHNQRSGYPTQKPEALLERIILASSNPGDLVADFFCGSGTTPVVAARLGRRFLAVDATFLAIHTTRERLVRGQNMPFEIHLSEPDQMNELSTHEFEFQLSQGAVQAVGKLLPSYWEVDPAWNGGTFHSAFQAIMPLRSEGIARSIQLPENLGSKRVAVRVVSSSGEKYQMELGQKNQWD